MTENGNGHVGSACETWWGGGWWAWGEASAVAEVQDGAEKYIRLKVSFVKKVKNGLFI
jgi:hypothetical protein